MKNIYIIAFFVLLPLLGIQAQNSEIIKRWSENTAYTMSGHSWETGLFQSLRIGLSDKVELRSNVLIIPILPNVGVKVSYGQKNDLYLASEHSLSYPSMFLKTFQMKGTGGLISPQYEIPMMFSLSNTFLASKPLGEKSLLSANAGLSFVIRNGSIDYRASIDEPFFYQRMTHYYKGLQIRAGGSYKTQLLNNLFAEENIKIYGATRKNDNIFIENQGVLMFSTKGSFRIRGGYMLSWGSYPFGNHLQMWPVIDIMFGKFK
jgi:hypothetical protein